MATLLSLSQELRSALLVFVVEITWFSVKIENMDEHGKGGVLKGNRASKGTGYQSRLSGLFMLGKEGILRFMIYSDISSLC